MKPTDANLAEFRKMLLRWWRNNARQYPWRHLRTPYRTVIAELMLRRTRADQVVPVFNRFLELYPTLGRAAEAKVGDLAPLLRPLGLEWRAADTAQFVHEAHARYGADLPTDVDSLKQLPGVGEYVASAVACFAANEPVALIDTNIVRVLGRLFGLNTEGEARRRREVRDLATRAVAADDPASYHYAVLDFAAKVCTARNPKCSECPFSRASLCCYYARTPPASQP